MTLIRDCGTRISDIYTTAVVAVSAHASAPDEEVKKGLKLIGTDDICTRLWTPLLHGLNDLIMFSSPDVRSIALENFYDTLNKQGDSFSQNYWTIISSKIIIPQFIDLTAASSPKRFEQDEDQMMWISTTATQALGKFVELFTNVICTQFLYPQLCSILKSSILFENENVSRIASKLLQQIIEKNCSRFSETDWNTTLVIFQELFQESAPRFLFFNYDETEETSNALQFPFLEQPLGPPPDKNKFKADIRFCSTHILAIQTLTDVLSLEMFFSHSPKTVAKELLNCFYKSYELAKAFNNCMELRDALYRKGYMKQLPNLQKQETLSVNAFITFQFEFYKSINDPQVLSKLFPYILNN